MCTSIENFLIGIWIEIGLLPILGSQIWFMPYMVAPYSHHIDTFQSDSSAIFLKELIELLNCSVQGVNFFQAQLDQGT